ncbi:MAG: IclR family transcriptional regulator [Bdellovibrionota bacterium]
MGKKREKANYMIQSVSHAVDVLEELSKAGAEVGVTELSKRLKLHKNNVFRLLATLELRGYVEQNLETEDYRLGVKSLQLGQAYLAQSDLVQRSLPIMRKLSESTGETVSLAILQNGQVQFPISIGSKRPVSVAARNNTSVPAKMSAAGRLLTAQLPDSILDELLAGNSPQDAAIKNQLNELRSSGMITDKAAIEPDVTTVAKLIRGHNDQVVGAIEILAPQYRAKLEDLTSAVKEAASNLSSTLGAVKPGLIATIEKEVSTSATM